MPNVTHSGKELLLSLMSNGYKNGRYSKVYNTQCSLIPKELKDNKFRQINLDIHEFAPRANSTGLCFYSKESEKPPFCSGSRELSTSFTISINSTTGWHFGLNASHQIGQVPEFRFWIFITILVTPKDESIYDLKCKSHIGMLSKIEGNGQNEFRIAFYTVAAIGIVIALSGLVICWKTRSRTQGNISSEDDIYYDLQITGMPTLINLPEPNMATRGLVRQLSFDSQATTDIHQSSYRINLRQENFYGDNNFGTGSSDLGMNGSVSGSNNTMSSTGSWDSIAMQIVDNELYQSRVSLNSPHSEILDNEVYDATAIYNLDDYSGPLNEENESYEYVASVNEEIEIYEYL